MSAPLAAAVLATGLRLVASHGYAEGAPPGFTGGFKQGTCHACHFHEPMNAPPGRAAIEGLSETYVPGERYTLTITLERAGARRAGFQLAARFESSGAQAGTLAKVDDDETRIAIERDGEVQYAGQTAGGSSADPSGTTRWTLTWTAPGTGGPVAFHLSANAANGDETADGDFVYTVTARASPAEGPPPAPGNSPPRRRH